MLMHCSIPQYQDLTRSLRDVRLEYLKGTVLAMPGDKPIHNTITADLIGILFERLRGKPCKVMTGDTRIYVPQADLLAFPDVVVMCEPEEMYDSITVLNPTGLIEVLSESPESYDRTIKLPAYLSLASVRQVLLVAQDQIRIESYPDGMVYHSGDTVHFLDLLFPADDAYQKVYF
jgi:Uma2 family endonuclease